MTVGRPVEVPGMVPNRTGSKLVWFKPSGHLAPTPTPAAAAPEAGARTVEVIGLSREAGPGWTADPYAGAR